MRLRAILCDFQRLTELHVETPEAICDGQQSLRNVFAGSLFADLVRLKGGMSFERIELEEHNTAQDTRRRDAMANCMVYFYFNHRWGNVALTRSSLQLEQVWLRFPLGESTRKQTRADHDHGVAGGTWKWLGGGTLRLKSQGMFIMVTFSK